MIQMDGFPVEVGDKVYHLGKDRFAKVIWVDSSDDTFHVEGIGWFKGDGTLWWPSASNNARMIYWDKTEIIPPKKKEPKYIWAVCECKDDWKLSNDHYSISEAKRRYASALMYVPIKESEIKK